MIKRTYKILIILLTILTLNNIFCTTKVLADNYDIWQKAKDWLTTGATVNDGGDTVLTAVGDTKGNFERVIDFLWGIGLLAAGITTVVLGIKMMTVPPGEKSRVKQSLYPYLIGVIVIFGALTIWKVLIDILDGSLW